MNKILILAKDPRHYNYKKYSDYLKNYNVVFHKLYMEPKVKKSSVQYMKQVILDDIIPTIKEDSFNEVICCDAGYFKVLTKLAKAEPYLGYKITCRKEYGSFNVYYCPSAEQIFYSPETVLPKVYQALDAVKHVIADNYQEPGSNIIHKEYYPDSIKDIAKTFKELHQYSKLTCDIETLSLKFYHTNISTITFCWNEHEGTAFRVGLNRSKEETEQVNNLLKDFITNYKGTLIFHNISFDATILINTLWIKHQELSQRNLDVCEGLKHMFKNFDDTKLISYLALNSCTRVDFGLKAQAQEYSGNYAQDEISDITKIPVQDLLRYNLIDGLSTWYVYNKNYPKMVKDDQEKIYKELFKPAVIDIVHMQLSGMPMDPEEIQRAKESITKDIEEAKAKVYSSSLVQDFNKSFKEIQADKKNAVLKKKKVLPEDMEDFNIASTDQLQKLLYDYLALPVVDVTDSKQPATGADTLEKLKNHTDNEEIKTILQGLIDYKAAIKIVTAFIPAMEKGYDRENNDKTLWLHGSFNLGGTVSGRLSSSEPNLQNLPATGSRYAKTIKHCFRAPKGWLFAGLDFSALEDHISALLTKDKNKLKVYTNHYDGHCLRAYSYFSDQMPDIKPVKETTKCFKAKVGEKLVYFTEFDTINYKGQLMTGAQYYESQTIKRRV